MSRCTTSTEPYPCAEEEGHEGPHRTLSGLEIDVYQGDKNLVFCDHTPEPDDSDGLRCDKRIGHQGKHVELYVASWTDATDIKYVDED